MHKALALSSDMKHFISLWRGQCQWHVKGQNSPGGMECCLRNNHQTLCVIESMREGDLFKRSIFRQAVFLFVCLHICGINIKPAHKVTVSYKTTNLGSASFCLPGYFSVCFPSPPLPSHALASAATEFFLSPNDPVYYMFKIHFRLVDCAAPP